MKKLNSFVILFATAFLLSACGGDSGLSPEPSKPTPTNQGPNISTTENTKLHFSHSGGSSTISFIIKGSWTASSSQNWCTISPTNGQAGNVTITFTTIGNDTKDNRIASVTLKSLNDSLTIIVTQDYDFKSVERAALMDLYNSTDGANWKRNDNWGSKEPLNIWFGVSTDQSGHVTELYLYDNNLTGTIPESIGNLANLSYLNLHWNNLTGIIPESIGKLTNLTQLHIEYNKLTGSLPNSLSNLNKLEFLALGYNLLDAGPIPVWIEDLQNLTILSLGECNLSGPIPSFLGNLTNLKELNLSGNSLTGSIPESFANLSNIKELVLGNNQLTGSMPAFLGNLSNLEVLRLENNNLYGTIPDSFMNLNKLVSLDLSGNRMDGTLSDELLNSDWWKRCDPKIIQQEGYMLKYSSLYESSDYSENGKVLTLQKHTIGKGIPLVILGEAFSDRMIADNTYNKMATQTMDAFFEIEPFNTFRNYFDVYAVIAVSPNEIPGETTAYNVNIERSIPDVGWTKIEEDILSIPSLNGSLDNVTCLLLLNGKKYSGSWHTFFAGTYNVAECSYFLDGGSYTIGNYLVHHEGGGHAFGYLTDEMVYDGASEVFPESSYSNIENNHSQGWEYNIDYHSTKETSFWKDFFANPDYEVEKLDLYEGAVYTYAKGIYRPSYRSIMYAGEDTDYYNAPSRLAIYKRIMELSGEGYSFEKFLDYDKKNLEAIKNGAITRNYVERRNGDIPIKSPCVKVIK